MHRPATARVLFSRSALTGGQLLLRKLPCRRSGESGLLHSVWTRISPQPDLRPGFGGRCAAGCNSHWRADITSPSTPSQEGAKPEPIIMYLYDPVCFIGLPIACRRG